MLNMENDLWEEINEMFKKSYRDIIINLNEFRNGENTLNKLQITSKSVLGSIVLNTTGIIVDNWIRILGSDSDENRGILSYNKIEESGIAKRIDQMLIVADDVIGGVFALNSGRFSDGIGDVWYFGPDTLEWESLGMKYSELIAWIAQGNVDEFYSNLRWQKWKENVMDIKFNDALLIYPFLWSNEIEIETADKKIVSVEELFNINQDYSKKFDLS